MFNSFIFLTSWDIVLSFEKSGNIGSYQDRVFVNTIAILWWKNKENQKRLKSIYKTLKKNNETYLIQYQKEKM